jgi:hypothetical protein
MIPPEIEFDICAALLFKAEHEYWELKDSPEGATKFRGRAERLIAPYCQAYGPIRAIWRESSITILRRAAAVQLPLVTTLWATYRTRYLRCRLRYILWGYYCEQSTHISTTMSNNCCDAFDL